ncbi:hypothetical protein QTI51_31855 [Variovorax sp. J22G73]|uniref:hypothetical protein n=1 Tax=unclassified Variovorax TaxID=663243 RepID=UPI002575CB3B|nr:MULTISPECIES: hypothetical protein [unclassified Variovorax]MDM0009405.1 hypothetical protein [Variovorax sp. J22R203]MDM0101912.1 hypothetical protein [Variovorax sp. J22G73]
MCDIAGWVAVLALPMTVALTGCKPEASTTPTAPTGACNLVVSEKQQIAKLNAYGVAYNKLLQWHSFGRIQRDYRLANPKVAKAGAPLDSYSFAGGMSTTPCALSTRPWPWHSPGQN